MEVEKGYRNYHACYKLPCSTSLLNWHRKCCVIFKLLMLLLRFRSLEMRCSFALMHYYRITCDVMRGNFLVFSFAFYVHRSFPLSLVKMAIACGSRKLSQKLSFRRICSFVCSWLHTLMSELDNNQVKRNVGISVVLYSGSLCNNLAISCLHERFLLPFFCIQWSHALKGPLNLFPHIKKGFFLRFLQNCNRISI